MAHYGVGGNVNGKGPGQPAQAIRYPAKPVLVALPALGITAAQERPPNAAVHR